MTKIKRYSNEFKARVALEANGIFKQLFLGDECPATLDKRLGKEAKKLGVSQ